jgi:arsenate reductase
MAEGFTRHFFGDRIEAFSAGIVAAGVNAETVQVMAEIEIDISKQTSKHYGRFLDEKFDYVITLCDELEERCPIFPGKATHIHLGFRDPVTSPGVGEDRLNRFRRTRDEMKTRLTALLERLLAGETPGNEANSGL